jgi:hypothetical protein
MIKANNELHPRQIKRKSEIGFGDYLELKLESTFLQIGAWMLIHFDLEDIALILVVLDVSL